MLLNRGLLRSLGHKAKIRQNILAIPYFPRTVGICVSSPRSVFAGAPRWSAKPAEAPAVPREGRQGRSLGATSWAVREPGLSLGCPLACRDTWWQTGREGWADPAGVRGSWAPLQNCSEPGGSCGPEVNTSKEWPVKRPKTVSEGWHFFHNYFSRVLPFFFFFF